MRKHLARSMQNRPTLERLEDRNLLSVTATLQSGGNLAIEGGTRNDTITVREIGNTIRVDGVVRSFAVSRVNSITINGNAGNDNIDLRVHGRQRALTISTTIDGGAGNDVIHGGEGADDIS